MSTLAWIVLIPPDPAQQLASHPGAATAARVGVDLVALVLYALACAGGVHLAGRLLIALPGLEGRLEARLIVVRAAASGTARDDGARSAARTPATLIVPAPRAPIDDTTTTTGRQDVSA